jgi:hypothetical protein
MRCARGISDFGQNGTRSRKQRGAGRQEADTTRGSLEQLHTESRIVGAFTPLA